MNCQLCDRVLLTKSGNYPYLIHEFEHSYLLLGEHQFFDGYSVLVSKLHFREMSDLPYKISKEFFQEMMISSRAIERAFSPKKMNMCSLGNVVDHVHWHFFPRYSSDPEFSDPPWLRMKLFETAKVSPSMAMVNIEKIQQSLRTESVGFP